jgi:hypothetical protein
LGHCDRLYFREVCPKMGSEKWDQVSLVRYFSSEYELIKKASFSRDKNNITEKMQ